MITKSTTVGVIENLTTASHLTFNLTLPQTLHICADQRCGTIDASLKKWLTKQLIEVNTKQSPPLTRHISDNFDAYLQQLSEKIYA